LYRTVDTSGPTLDFLRTAHRDPEAARRFLRQASRRHGLPETVTIDGSEANEAALTRDNEAPGTPIIIRPVKSLHNIVAQDHRAVQRVTRPMRGGNAFDAAQATLAEIERRHMLKKRQMMVEAGDEELTAATQFYALAS
jgi:transposase-like protein